EGATLSLSVQTRGDTVGVVKAGESIKLEVFAENHGATGERIDVVVSLRDPSGSRAGREKRFSIDAFTGETLKQRLAIPVPDGARSGTWIIVADGTVRGSGASLVASIAITVK